MPQHDLICDTTKFLAIESRGISAFKQRLWSSPNTYFTTMLLYPKVFTNGMDPAEMLEYMKTKRSFEAWKAQQAAGDC